MLEAFLLGRRSRIVKITHGDELYFCLFGIPLTGDLPDGIETTDLTPALLTCAVLEAKVLPIATGLEIKDAIESEYIGTKDYCGHDVNAISKLFPPLVVVKGDSNYEFQHDLQRVMGSFLVRSLNNQQIELQEETIDTFITFFEAGSAYIPFGIIIRSLISVTWEGLFLDAYRCIEQIYSCIKVGELREDWDSEKSLRQLAELLESHLAWRPKEDDAFGSILEKCDPLGIKDACTLLELPTEETLSENGLQVTRPRSDDKLARSVAKHLYGIRNNLVHYRPVHELIKKSDDEWNSIIRLMLGFVQESYSLFGPNFFEKKISSGLPLAQENPTNISA